MPQDKGIWFVRSLAVLFVLMAMGVVECPGATKAACVGSAPLGTFQLLAESPKGAGAISVKSVNVIKPGERLKYEPLHLPEGIKGKAKIALMLVPASDETSQNLVMLEAKPAGAAAEWAVPIRASVVGVVFGPRGLDTKQVSSMVKKDEDLIPQLANYAEQTTTVEALVQTLSTYEQSESSGANLNAALQGFSSQYNVALPKLDTSAPPDQQAATLLHAVLPSLSSYDPLAPQRSQVVQQSAGLAASVAALFLGSPVGLAAGGASLLQNVRTLVSPGTEFRSAFALPSSDNGLALCTKRQQGKDKSRTRVAYLWVMRVPDANAPQVSLVEPAHLPLGWKSTVKLKPAKAADGKLLARARDWQLVSAAHGTNSPVAVEVDSTGDALAIDLKPAKVPAGDYRLAAKWDWDPLEIAGTLQISPFPDLASAQVTPESTDRLVEGHGTVQVDLAGADFEFVKTVTLEEKGNTKAAPQELSFTRPREKAAGAPDTLEVEVDTSSLRPGEYVLKLAQWNGASQGVPVSIQPPNPKIENLPLRANLGETRQTLILKGSGLERIEKISSKDAVWNLGSVPSGSQNLTERKATITLGTGARQGEQIALTMNVTGIHDPLLIPNAIQVAGPRPRITGAKVSFAQEADVALRDTEIPAGSSASFVMQVANLDARPSVDLGCGDPNDVKQALTLRPGIKSGPAELDFAGEGVLFLSLEPGIVGQNGCTLTATVTSESTGTSDPYVLGRVVRLPHIDKFTLSDVKLGGSLYSGEVTGSDLQMIEKTGWNAKTGFPVQGIPTSVPGNPQGQTLEIELPWPPPAPQSPLYVWLRGEAQGRVTRARY